MRPRSGKNEPFRGLGCRFVDQNVALLSHTPCRRPQYCTVAHKKDTHKSTEWKTGHTAQPLFAPQALTRRRWHGWLQEVRHLLYCFRFSAGCCLAAASAAAPDLHRLLAAAHPQMRPRGRPESSAGASDKPALSFSWFSLCVAAASGVSFVRIITSHSSVNPLL